MGARIYEYDWSRTPLGPIRAWDESVRNAVSLTIKSEFPMFVFIGPELIQVYNDAAIPFTVGKHPVRSFGIPWAQAWSEVADRLEGLLSECINADKSLMIEGALLPILRNGRMEEAYITFSYSPFQNAEGAFCGVHCITLEVTASVVAKRRLETIHQIVLASISQTFDDAARGVAAVLTENDADVPFAAFYRFDDPSTATRIAVSGGAAADAFFTLHIEDDAADGWPIERLSIGRPSWVRFPRTKLGAPPAGAFPEPIEQAVIMPISISKKTIGCFIAGVNPRIPMTTEYNRFYRTIAREMSTALTNTAVHDLERLESERQSRASQSFQDASLPRSLPDVYGIEFDALYVPASDEAKVGGDWYDALVLPDGRIVVSIGDVAGHGLLAAVTMGNIRQIIRGIAQVHADPALILQAADRALRLEHSNTYVTAWVGVVDLVGRSLTFASAGHPPPFVRTAAGTVEQLPEGGLPLGLRGYTEERARVVPLAEGSVLFLYTDGLTEVWRDVVTGERNVRDALTVAGSGDRIAREVLASIIGDAQCADDVAIMTVHIRAFAEASSSFRVWDFETRDAAAAESARRDFREMLAANGWRAADIDNAEVILGELVGNAVRYAPGPVQMVLDLTSRNPVLHVLDRGPGFEHLTTLPRDVYSESGRGLFIIGKFGRDLLIQRRVDGGSHASVIIAKRTFSPTLALPKAPGAGLTY